MNHNKLENYFLLFLIIGVLALSYVMLSPFLDAFILASVSAIIFQPLYRKILSHTSNHKGLSSIITSLVIAVFILVPLLLLGMQIFRETEQLYVSLSGSGARDATLGFIKSITDGLQHYFPSLPAETFSVDISKYFGNALSSMVGKLGSIFSSIAKILTGVFVFLITLYYLFKDGDKLVKSLINLSPLVDTDDEIILNKLHLAINSIVSGTLAIGFIQGIISYAGFEYFGIPNPALWGAVTAVSALIPGIGTALILIPAILFLFLSGQTIPGIGLLIWSITAVGLIDNFLGPRLMGRGMLLHPLLVFLSVLGGIISFGPLGFILGPIILNLLFALLEIYSRLIKPTTQKI